MNPVAQKNLVSDGSLRTSFLEWLVTEEQITTATADQVRRVADQTGDKVPSILLKLGLLSEHALALGVSRFAGVGLWDGCIPHSDQLGLVGLNQAFLRTNEVLPVSTSEDCAEVLCWDATDSYVPRALEFALGRPIKLCIGQRSEVILLLQQLHPADSVVGAEAPSDELAAADELDRLTDLASDAPVIRMVQRLFDAAVQAHASDIHLEPSEGDFVVRLRLDGMLREIERHPKAVAAPIVSRIKVMAGLDIAERRLPQDGRIRVTVQGKEIDFRVATSPVLHGESVVLRILDRQDIQLDFVSLGFDSPLIAMVREAIARPHGIVLVTGPTGSGKTTTLYAALKEINSPDRKLLTVEDPVEYVLAGVNQVPIRPQIGLTFAQALRAFLRQDPDVLMVGEIRDRETAETAVQAALTGHMLLSTLHTNSAAAAITRLMDMGIDDFLLTSTLHLILGQRLVRKLCDVCREPYEPDASVLARCAVHESNGLVWHRPKGCSSCQNTGYRGRTTLIEALRLSDATRAAVLRRADAHEIEQVAVSEGMRTLFQHGIQRVMEAATSVEEVLRVTSLR